MNKYALTAMGKVLKPLWQMVRGLIHGLVGVLGIGLTVIYIIRWGSGDSLFWTRMLSYFMPWALLGLVPGLILAFLTRCYRLALLLVLPTGLIGLPLVPLFLPRLPAVLATAQPPLKVMSYNLWSYNFQTGATLELIRREQPGILLLQEAYMHNAFITTLLSKLEHLYPNQPFYLAYDPPTGQAILSRYPLKKIEVDVDKGRVQKVLIDSPVGQLAVWNVHAADPYRWASQYRQLTALAEDIAAFDGPLIVAGDFNTTDQTDTYALLTHHLRNAHWEAGWGFGFTFPAHAPNFKGIPVVTPMVRIDHIFYNHHFFAQRAWTLPDSAGSDHFPVVAELSPVR